MNDKKDKNNQNKGNPITESKTTNDDSMSNNRSVSHSGSEGDGSPSHHTANRIIDKFIQRKMANAPPETRALLRRKSVFDLVGAENREKQKKKKNGRFAKFVRKVKKFRTIVALVLLQIYLIFGAVMFLHVEKDATETIEAYKEEMLEQARELYTKIQPSQCPKTLNKSDTIDNNWCLKAIYTQLYEVNPPNKNIDCFMDALIYVVTCITTIGYGNLVCYTTGGKLLTVLYCILGIALILYVLRNNGKFALKCCNKLNVCCTSCFYSCASCAFNREMNYTTPPGISLFKSIMVLFVFWTFGALSIAVFEEFSFYDAIYFSFSTFSTIGFGDFVPTSHVSSAIIFILHFIDLSLLSMLFAQVHESMENNFMVVLELLDEGYRRHHTATMELHMASPGVSRAVSTTTAKEKSAKE